MGAFLIVAIWILCGIILWFVITYEDREQKRERIARAQGYYPPVRTLKQSRTHPPMFLQPDTEPSSGNDATAREQA